MFTVITVRVGLIPQVHLVVPERMVRLLKYVVVVEHRRRLVISVSTFIVILARAVHIRLLIVVLMEHRERFLRYVVAGQHPERVINVRRIIVHILVRVGLIPRVRLAAMGHRVRHIKLADVVQVTIPQLVTLVKNLRIITVTIVTILLVHREW